MLTNTVASFAASSVGIKCINAIDVVGCREAQTNGNQPTGGGRLSKQILSNRTNNRRRDSFPNSLGRTHLRIPTMTSDELAVPHSAEDQTKEIAPFLRSLRRMLDRESDAILRWTDDGKAFEIHDMDVMTSYILPKYFKHAKYTSFQRQLNYFNFRKWTKSRATVCTFSNAFFVRDEPDLTWRITRKRGLSDAKAPGSPSSGNSSDSASPRSPKCAKLSSAKCVSDQPRANTTTSKPASTKKEPSLKRKATANSISTSQKKQAVKVTKPVTPVKMEESTGVQTPTDVESLEWVDTLYPSLEVLEAECSSSDLSGTVYAPWSVQYPVDHCFGVYLSSTVVQAQCIAL
ncbi:Hsf-type dna-binding protein, partial [Globisporangium splendens]